MQTQALAAEVDRLTRLVEKLTEEISRLTALTSPPPDRCVRHEHVLVWCVDCIEVERTAARKRHAAIASMFTVKPDRRIHPDIPWAEMNETAKMVANTTAQQIAWEILDDGTPPLTDPL